MKMEIGEEEVLELLILHHQALAKSFQDKLSKLQKGAEVQDEKC